MNPESQPQEPEPTGPYEGGPLGAGIDWSDPNSRLAPLYLTTGGVIGVVVLALFFLVAATASLSHTDFWAHLKYGEWIATEGSVPDREPLNPFTDKQSRMFDAQWLAQVGYSWLFRTGSAVAGGDARRQFEGGVEAVRLAHLLAAVAAVGLIGLACRRVADSVPWAVGGMVLVLVLMRFPLTIQRPQTFAIFCFAALLCGLSRPLLTRRALVWIPLLLVVWANLHGSFVIGLGLLGVVLVGRVVERVRESGWRAAVGDTGCHRLGLALLVSAAAVAVLNPYGPRLYLEVARFGESPNLRTMGEWQPLDFSETRGGHWVYLATLVLLAVTQFASPRPLTATQLLLVVTLGVWPLFQQRMFLWWAPLVPWLVAPHWVAAAGRWGWSPPENTPSFKKTMLAVVLVVVTVFASRAGRPRPVAKALHRATPYDVAAALKGEPAADPERVAALARVVREEHGGRFVGRVFCSETLGEYLLWALPPEAPVMMYNHAQLFPPGHWAECLAVKAGTPGWWEILDRYRAGVVVVEAGSHLELCAELRKHPDWRVVLDEASAPAGLFVAVRKPAGATP